MIKSLIFDFDGTISDSYPIFVRIVRDVAAEFDVKVTMSDEELMDKMMINVGACMRAMNFPGEPIDRANCFWKHQRLHRYEFQAFPEIEPILKKSLSLGKKNYIYTHSGDVVHEMLENMGLHHYFAGFVTADHGFAPKPAPDALFYLCETYGVDPAESMIIGDRDIDTMSGNNAGMKGCLWDSGDRYPDYQTDYKIKTLDELYEMLDRI